MQFKQTKWIVIGGEFVSGMKRAIGLREEEERPGQEGQPGSHEWHTARGVLRRALSHR